MILDGKLQELKSFDRMKFEFLTQVLKSDIYLKDKLQPSDLNKCQDQINVDNDHCKHHGS